MTESTTESVRMNPEVKARWVEALRSGRYPRAKGALCVLDPDDLDRRTVLGYCCLGVLTELAVDAGVLDVSPDTSGGGNRAYGARRESAYLPDEVVRWAELSSRNPIVRSGEGVFNHSRSLAALNDQDVPFGVIADLVEEQL